MPHFCVSVPLENPLKRALDDERAQAGRILLPLLVRIAPRNHEKRVGHVGQRDPHLLAVQHIAIAALLRRRLDAARVASRRRLGEAVGGDQRALRLRNEILLFLRFGSPRQQRQAVERDVHRQDDAQRRVRVLELFARDAEADVVHARAAVLRRHADAEQPELGHLRQQAAIERVLAIELLDARRNLPRRPLARRLLDEPMLFV